MTLKLILILAGMLTLFGGCASEQMHLGREILAADQPEKPLSAGETIYPVSTGLCRGLAPDPQATIDSAADVCFSLGLAVHVAGLTPSEATAALQRAYQPRDYKNWDFVISRVQPKD